MLGGFGELQRLSSVQQIFHQQSIYFAAAPSSIEDSLASRLSKQA